MSLSGSILVIAKSPLGLNEVYRLLSSSIIAADAPDVWLFGSIAAVVVAAGVVFRNSLSLLVIDPAFASAAGLRAPVWWTVIAAASGAVIGVSIAAAGALYAFGCLVLPGLIAKNLSRNTAPIFIAAPLIAVFFGVFGFAAANSMDLPPAQVTVLLMCFGLAFAWLYRRGHY